MSEPHFEVCRDAVNEGSRDAKRERERVTHSVSGSITQQWEGVNGQLQLTVRVTVKHMTAVEMVSTLHACSERTWTASETERKEESVGEHDA